MKEAVRIVVLAALATVVTVAALSLADHGQPSKSPAKNTAATIQPASLACKLLTLEDATAVLGRGTAAVPGQPEIHGDDVSITTCNYTVVTGKGANDSRSITLLVRLPKNAEAARYNKANFGVQKPAGVQDVAGIGDAAYWAASISQLNVLVGDTWYIIGNTTGQSAGHGTLDTSRAIYNQIKQKLD